MYSCNIQSTGKEKSLIFQAAPMVFDAVKRSNFQSIAVVYFALDVADTGSSRIFEIYRGHCRIIRADKLIIKCHSASVHNGIEKLIQMAQNDKNKTLEDMLVKPKCKCFINTMLLLLLLLFVVVDTA